MYTFCMFKNAAKLHIYSPLSGLLLVCVLTHEGAVLVEKKIVLGNTRDNFSVATAALSPCECFHLNLYFIYVY